ncbi:uroporphyrinogen-III synthase [Jannaschia marina]|uniref:uroporphyrinogen-III synthase n=1 Tax=Jannaschia marina TaxID=2741674 RepID=UPI0015CBC998|nr:uroporphyrinogen-III synthase [Jannaschia marina]
MQSLPVLLTRPEADAQRFAAALRRAADVEVVISPLLRILPLDPPPPGTETLLLTSGNAVRIGLDRAKGQGRRAWVVGPRTADLARAAGVEVLGTAADVDTLVDLVPGDAGPLLHLRGAVTRGDLAGRLRARGLSVAEHVAYRQEPQPLSEQARAVLRAGPVLAPVFSPRSAELLGAACTPRMRGNLRPLALSAAVAEALPRPPVAVSARPDGMAMLELTVEVLRRSAVEGGRSSV